MATRHNEGGASALPANIVRMADYPRRRRDPDMEEASEKLAACTVWAFSAPEGSTEREMAEGARAWWFREVTRLNPGGAEVVSLPRPKVRRTATN